MRLLAHEASHVVQQSAAAVSGSRGGAGLVISDPGDSFEHAADQEATRVAALASGGGNRAAKESPGAHPASTESARPSGVVQRKPTEARTGVPPAAGPTTTPPVSAPTAAQASPGGVSRNDVELMGMRLKTRQVSLGVFLNEAKGDVDSIRAYYRSVNSVYTRTYGHYKLCIQQANAQVDSEQKWVNLVAGIAVGVSLGLMSEATLGALATRLAYELLVETATELGEGLLGSALTPQLRTATISDELHPAWKQVQALQQLDQLSSAVLGMAIPGATVYSNAIVLAERLSAELRVAEAGGERRMSDADIRSDYLKLMGFELKGLGMDNALNDVEPKFAALRKGYLGKQAPSDQRCEQDIWIPWIAEQDPNPTYVIIGSILENDVLVNHFVDIGLAARGSRGGRLKANVEKPELEPEAPPDDSTGPTKAPFARLYESPAQQLQLAAAAEVRGLSGYWNDVFLMGGGQKKA